MSTYESVPLKSLAYVGFGATALALGIVAATWGVLGIFVL